MQGGGERDRLVQIMRDGQTGTTPLNEPIIGETEYLKVWAKKRDVSDAERHRAEEIGATITTRFLLRWSTRSAAIVTTDDLVCEGRRYEIEGVKEIGRREEIELTCAARTEVAPT